MHICNLAIIKICQSGEVVWELQYAASIEIVENGIDVTIEKRKEFLQKVALEMSKDQRSENVQQSLKSNLHCQDAGVTIHS